MSNTLTGSLNIKYITRNNIPANDRPNILVIYHDGDDPEERQEFFQLLLKMYDCAITYLEPSALSEGTEWSSENVIDQAVRSSALIIVLISNRFMSDIPAVYMSARECAARQDSHTPVLPVLLEMVPIRAFAGLFGDVQFLTTFRQSDTELPFEDKLKSIMDEILPGEQMKAEIRDSFRLKLFLSYRKKDRRLAQELMRLVHFAPCNIDIAIWYDEFLTPGENYNSEIKGWIEDCDYVLLAVTKNMLEDGNYVLQHEYPDSVKAGKQFIPVLLEDVDINEFRHKFTGIEDRLISGLNDLIIPDSEGEVFARLLGDINSPEDEYSAETVYRLGLAYLNGILVETDAVRGRLSVETAANAMYPPAVSTMSDLLRYGRGIERDIIKSHEWKNRSLHVDHDRIMADEKFYHLVMKSSGIPADINALILFDKVLAEFNSCLEDGLVNIAWDYVDLMISICEDMIELTGMNRDASSSLQLAEWFIKYSDAACSESDLYLRTAIAAGESGSSENISKGLEAARVSCAYPENAMETLGKSGALRDEEGMALYEKAFESLVVNLQHYYDIAEMAGREDIMCECVQRCNKLLEERDPDCKKYRLYWFIHKAQLGKVFLNNGNANKGLFHYSEALAIGDDIFESGDASIRLKQGVVCDRLTDYFLFKREDKEKALNVADMGYKFRQEALKYAPDDYDPLHDIALSEERYGHIYFHKGKYETALMWYYKCRETRQKIARYYPSENAQKELEYIELCINQLEAALSLMN